MSRVVANILGRRPLDDGFYARCINAIAASQWRDDLIDHEDDLLAGRETPFTTPPAGAATNPLHDLFAYGAYVSAEVFGADPVATDALTYRAAGALATYLAADPRRADRLTRRYDTTPEIRAFLRTAAGMNKRVIGRLDFADQRLKRHTGRILGLRDQGEVDFRTFVADRIGYINDIMHRHRPPAGAAELDRIVGYALAARGKRLRPALSLLLAEALHVDPASIEPALAAGELLHTASLLFDDLPAQDDATLRRGRPAAHLAFDEGTVQLAALSMIFFSFGLLARLDGPFPASKVAEVLAYVGTVAGQRMCRGQSADLRLGRHGGPVTVHDIVSMYALKTSTALEAALVPIMILLARPETETETIRRYAYHAGIVFQTRDDILDATSTPETLGKDADNDLGRTNLVRTFGIAVAREVMRDHLAEAIACCGRLPFDTRLLERAVRYFAARTR
jgi:geranylgeranyl pyrophosphate synthase